MKSAKLLVVIGMVAVVAGSLVACSVKPVKLYEEGSIDEKDVASLDVSQQRVTVHVDGKKIAIRTNEVLMAPGTYSLRIEANTSFDRNPDQDRYNELIAELDARGVLYGTILESPDHPIEVTLTFTPQAGKRYKLYGEFIERPTVKEQANERTPGEFVAYIEKEF